MGNSFRSIFYFVFKLHVDSLCLRFFSPSIKNFHITCLIYLLVNEDIPLNLLLDMRWHTFNVFFSMPRPVCIKSTVNKILGGALWFRALRYLLLCLASVFFRYANHTYAFTKTVFLNDVVTQVTNSSWAISSLINVLAKHALDGFWCDWQHCL